MIMHGLSWTALLVMAAVLLAGCQVGERNEGDADGDFLDDVFETTGWNITVQFGVPECFVPGSVAPETTVAVASLPHDADSDQDGLEDLLEYTIGSDPTRADTDGDGILDQEEHQLTKGDTLRFPGSLSLNKADSDGDCLADRDELEGFDIEGVGARTPDPSARDTDGDGFTDPEEIFRTRTDPTKGDTDGDGANDRFDVQPLANLGLDLRFVSVRPKANIGANNVRIIYAVPIADGDPQSEAEGSGFAAPVGQETPVPAAASPGIIDVDDSSSDGFLHIDILGVKNEANSPPPGRPCGVLYDVVSDHEECIGEVRVAWANATFLMQGTASYAADGSVVTFDTADITFKLRLSVVEL